MCSCVLQPDASGEHPGPGTLETFAIQVSLIALLLMATMTSNSSRPWLDVGLYVDLYV